jgi:AcrR family transcriptional regulator
MNDSNKNLPGRPRSAQSHQAILQASLELLAEVGYDRMSIEAIATRAGVGKPTIYRRYKSKAELVAEAIESRREEYVIPDTGSLWGDIDALINSAATITFNPLGRQTVAMMIGSATSNPEFAQVYWTKYLQPRRQAFAVVFERAKARNEVPAEFDTNLVFDVISGLMLYALVFQEATESWESYIRRTINLLLQGASVNQMPNLKASL